MNNFKNKEYKFDKSNNTHYIYLYLNFSHKQLLISIISFFNLFPL